MYRYVCLACDQQRCTPAVFLVVRSGGRSMQALISNTMLYTDVLRPPNLKYNTRMFSKLVALSLWLEGCSAIVCLD